jgi:sterol desaturase/sphingolipid hydroxylase (fatty acid hydroxylase superfamily)
MEARFIRTLVLFAVLTMLFGILERFFPSVSNQPKWRRGVWLDTFYWFFTPMVIQILSMAAIALVFLPIYLLLGRSLAWEDILAGYGPLAQLPLWVQGLLAIVIGDFVGYWTHRWHHTQQLWDYHAVHHSAEIVDWLTAVRLHPVNDMISRVCQSSPVLLLGISPVAVEAYVPLLSAYVALIHANVCWTYGPFRYWLASPAFHRWHHAADEPVEGTDGEFMTGKNFAGLFPIFDVLFGTFYMPQGEQPKQFGIAGEQIKETFIDQLLYPFRNWGFIKAKFYSREVS